MGWEQRGNRFYYYRKRRDRDRVVSEYVGHGPLGEFTALHDERRKNERKHRKARQRDELQRITRQWEELDLPITLMEANIENLANAYLLIHGYHTHKGIWRKRSNNAPTK